MSVEWSLKRAFLRMLVIALLSSAFVGSYTFLFGEIGETEAKILMTTLSISYFSVTSLACAVAFERRASTWLSVVGLVVSVIGFLIFMPGIWSEWWDSEAIAKSMVILSIFAFSFAQVCLLKLVPLQRSIRWIFFVTAIAIFALATLGSGMIIFEEDDEWLLRFLGVLGILDGCGSLLVPVLFKLSCGVAMASDDGQFDHIELTCPRCGHWGRYPVGILRCTECTLEIRVELTLKSKLVPPKA